MRLPASVRGFGLVELMVALVLGLILTGAVVSAFVANKRAYAASESLGRVQENARAAFELMSRDIREAAGNACNSKLEPVNVLRDLNTNTYADFMGGIRGYDGTQAGLAAFGPGVRQRVSGTDAVVLKSATDAGYRVDPDNSSNVNVGTYQAMPASWANSIVLVCDPEHAAIFQVTDIDPNGLKVQVKMSSTPGNSSVCLAPDGNCPGGADKRYAFGCTNGWWKGGTTATATKPIGCIEDGAPPAVIAQLRSIGWFVGRGTKSGNSLYRIIEGPGAVTADEIAEGVVALELQYLLDGSYAKAEDVADDDWVKVTAVRIAIEFEGEDRGAVSDVAASAGQGIRRSVTHVVALRNRING